MAELLAQRWGWPKEQVSVVPNVLNGEFVRALGKPSTRAVPQDTPTFCYITRAYAHKNLGILGRVAEELRRRWGTDVKWVLTLTDSEFASLDELTQGSSVNLGPLRIDEVAQVYRACTGTIFTSLLESFSVTPLEAMAAGSSLVASDRDFVRDVAEDAAFYVDPNSPESVASGVHAVLTNAELRTYRRDLGLRLMGTWPDARARAVAYADLINAELLNT